EPFLGNIPPEMRIWVDAGERSDYLANFLSWPIVSAKFWDNVGPLVANECQILSLPLYYEHTEVPVEGYLLMNVTRCVEAIRKDEWFEVTNVCLDKQKVPTGVHLFRLAESPTVLIISRAVFDALSNKGIK